MKKAFTLIEVMVVLSILAIIAILAYNFFGGTMKEATVKQSAAKIFNDMRVLDDAVQKYYIDNGSAPAGAGTAPITTMISAGIIKAAPTPPSPVAGDYWVSTSNTDTEGTTAVDTVVLLDQVGISNDVCTEINTRYSAVGATLPSYDQNAGTGELQTVDEGAILCFYDTDNTRNIVVMLSIAN